MERLLIGGAGLLLLGLSLLISLRALYYAGAATNDPLYLSIKVTGLVLAALGLFVVLAVVANVLGVLLWAAFMVIAVMSWFQWGAVQQRSHLALLALAAEKQIPLAECSLAFAQE